MSYIHVLTKNYGIQLSHSVVDNLMICLDPFRFVTYRDGFSDMFSRLYVRSLNKINVIQFWHVGRKYINIHFLPHWHRLGILKDNVVSVPIHSVLRLKLDSLITPWTLSPHFASTLTSDLAWRSD